MKTAVLESIFNKVATPEIPKHRRFFPIEYCEILKKTCFEEYLRTVASEWLKDFVKIDPKTNILIGKFPQFLQVFFFKT